MEDRSLYCAHCQDFVAPRTYRRHKQAYYNEEHGLWDINDSYSSSDEDHLYDHGTPFDVEREDREEEEYMEVDNEQTRRTLEFWEDSIEDVICDFDDSDGASDPSASIFIDAEDTRLLPNGRPVA